MKLSRLYNSKFFFLVYFILCGYYLFFDITLNSFSLSGEISFFKVLMFFISTLFFIYFLLEINRKKNKNIISFSKNSQKDYLDLFNNNSNIHAILDYDGNFTYMSQSSKKIIGLDHQSLIGKEFFKMIHPDDVNEVKNNFKKVLKKEKIDLIQFRIKNSINNWIWLETKIENKIDKFKIEGIILNARDVTKSIKEKQHLKLLESVITNTKDAVLITEAEPFDEPGPRIIYVNEAFTKMTGYSSKEVIGKTPRILQGPKSNKEELAKLSKAIRNWQPYEITTINYKKNGEEFWINFTVTPVINKKGFYTHWVAIERDVTDKILSNKKLIKAKEKAEENELKLKEAQKLAKIGYWEYDFASEILSWSDYIYEMYELQPEEYVPTYEGAKRFFDNQSQQKINESTKKLLETGAPYDLELRLINAKKEEIWVRNVVQPVYNDDKEIIGKRGIVQNITKEIYLRELNNEVAKMVKIGSWKVDLENRLFFGQKKYMNYMKLILKLMFQTLRKQSTFTEKILEIWLLP